MLAISFNIFDFIYIPLSINAFFSNIKSLQKANENKYYLSEIIFNSIKDIINKENNIILDFDNVVKLQANRMYDFINDLNDNNRNIILLNCNNIYENLSKYNKDGDNYYNNINYYKLAKLKCNDFNMSPILIDYLHNQTIDKSVIHCEDDWCYQYSSNVYSNLYIKIKNLFTDSNLLCLIIFLLKEKINKDEVNFDYILCASATGNAIATILGIIYQKRVVYLENIGPKFRMHNNIVNKINPNSKYIFIYDFISLGAEYNRTLIIVNIGNSSIQGAYGVSHYIDINRGKDSIKDDFIKYKSLFNINKNGQIYKCIVDMED